LLINAINLIDGLDGLAGGKSFIALFWMFIPAAMTGIAYPALSIAILMGALAAFLVYNMRNPLRRKANVFLGDAGSMALGLSLAWFGMRLGWGLHPVITPISVAWILALPIMDTCAQFARRVAQGRHPFSADRNHFHHHFVNVGITVGQATAIMTALGFILGLIGVGGMLLGVPEFVLAYTWIALLFLHMYMNMRPARLRRLILMMLRRGEDT
jgi:UDP-GlcNAc:undecaprenyl-phosphate GlcNAc-1-phosphate transferase